MSHEHRCPLREGNQLLHGTMPGKHCQPATTSITCCCSSTTSITGFHYQCTNHCCLARRYFGPKIKPKSLIQIQSFSTTPPSHPILSYLIRSDPIPSHPTHSIHSVHLSHPSQPSQPSNPSIPLHCIHPIHLILPIHPIPSIYCFLLDLNGFR